MITLSEALETAYRRAGGLPMLSRTPEGRAAIIKIAVNEAEALAAHRAQTDLAQQVLETWGNPSGGPQVAVGAAHRAQAGEGDTCPICGGTKDHYHSRRDGEALPLPSGGEREAIARVIAESYGVDPDDDAPTGKMCDAQNRPVAWWRVYEEQADAVLARFTILSPSPISEEVAGAVERLSKFAGQCENPREDDDEEFGDYINGKNCDAAADLRLLISAVGGR